MNPIAGEFFTSWDIGVSRLYRIDKVRKGNIDSDKEFTVQATFIAIFSEEDGCSYLNEPVDSTNGDLLDFENGSMNPGNWVKSENFKVFIPFIFNDPEVW